ncbi:MAG TPA: hypothetical protein PLD54_00575 [Candidatus Levybacteria bacterium]|nr:hypothetical protein [Candidatus Levybacteria bacterium]
MFPFVPKPPPQAKPPKSAEEKEAEAVLATIARGGKAAAQYYRDGRAPSSAPNSKCKRCSGRGIEKRSRGYWQCCQCTD